MTRGSSSHAHGAHPSIEQRRPVRRSTRLRLLAPRARLRADVRGHRLACDRPAGPDARWARRAPARVDCARGSVCTSSKPQRTDAPRRVRPRCADRLEHVCGRDPRPRHRAGDTARAAPSRSHPRPACRAAGEARSARPRVRSRARPTERRLRPRRRARRLRIRPPDVVVVSLARRPAARLDRPRDGGRDAPLFGRRLCADSRLARAPLDRSVGPRWRRNARSEDGGARGERRRPARVRLPLLVPRRCVRSRGLRSRRRAPLRARRDELPFEHAREGHPCDDDACGRAGVRRRRGSSERARRGAVRDRRGARRLHLARPRWGCLGRRRRAARRARVRAHARPHSLRSDREPSRARRPVRRPASRAGRRGGDGTGRAVRSDDQRPSSVGDRAPPRARWCARASSLPREQARSFHARVRARGRSGALPRDQARAARRSLRPRWRARRPPRRRVGGAPRIARGVRRRRTQGAPRRPCDRLLRRGRRRGPRRTCRLAHPRVVGDGRH